jgi:sugar lactone lactonase YvrE
VPNSSSPGPVRAAALPARTDTTLSLADRHYVVDSAWGAAALEGGLSRVCDVAVDSVGNAFIFQRSRPKVIVLTPSGQLLRTWGDEIADPHGIYIDGTDHVFVADRDAHLVHKFTSDGRLLFTLGDGSPGNDTPFSHPTDVAVSSDGDVFVSDGYGNARVHRFTADGKLLGSWGEHGAEAGQFNIPHALWFDADDQLYVADRENDRVQVFTTEGAHLAEWRGFHRPSDIFIDDRGYAFVGDMSTRVHALTLDGAHIGCGRSQSMCHGLSGSPQGDLYVAWPTPDGRLEKWVLQ